MQNALVTFFALLGLALGSFGNVLIYRLPERKVITGRSKCPHCGRVLGVLDLIPVISFLFLMGRCRSCTKPISWQYPFVETASSVLFVLALIHLDFVIVRSAVLGLSLWLLLLIAVTDAKTRLIPDALSLPLVATGVLLQFLSGSFDYTGMLLGGLFFGLQWLVSRGKWVGSGDIFLGIGIGALLGSWQMVTICLFVAYILGAIVALVLLTTQRKTLEDQLSFGPFLVIGAFVALFFGQMLWGFVGV